MRIAYDYQIFGAQRQGGISRYFASLARELALMGEQPRIIAPVHDNLFLETLPPRLVSGWSERRFAPLRNRIAKRALNAAVTRLQLRAWNPDVVHETHYSPERTGPARVPMVITVFDMIHELFPEQFENSTAKSAVKRAAIFRADHVVCISANTRDDLVRIFGTPPAPVSVIHLAADIPEPSVAVADIPAVAGEPFLLHVGVRGGYKNFARLCEAFAASPHLRKDFRLLAFGGGPFSASEKALLEHLGISDRVAQLEGDDALLDALYRRAVTLVYPSLYEGFGLPPLEAMARDCPVVFSNSSSMPEVIAGAGHAFDASDQGDMQRAIESVVYAPDSRADLIARGRERARAFSWRRCATETLAVYRQTSGAR